MNHIRRLIIILCFGITSNIFAAEITYDIYHHSEKLHIILQFNGNKNRVTNIKIPTNI